MSVLVVTPTYCEVDALPVTLARLRAAVPAADVLVVDDASPDGTGRVADELARADPGVHVLHRPGRAGLGPAYLAGFAWALQRGYAVVVEMDADGSHRPEQLERLLAALRGSPDADAQAGGDGEGHGDGADLALGSRWVPGGAVRRWPWSRRLLSRGGNAYTRVLLGMPLRDATGGFRAVRADVLRELDLAGVASQGYCFQVDLVWRAWRAGYRVVEVPITFDEREVGTSKMSGRIVREALWRVTVWGVRARASQLAAAGRRDRPAGSRRTGARS